MTKSILKLGVLLLLLQWPFSVIASEIGLPIVTVESEYIDAKTQVRLTMAGQGFIVDMFGTKVVITASHLTQGGVIQNKSNKLKVSYIKDGRVKPIKVQMQIADNMEDIALLFSRDLQALPAVATARYKGLHIITQFTDLEKISHLINYRHKDFEFPLNDEFKILFAKNNTEQLLRHFYPIGKSLFTRCPLEAPEFCAQNLSRMSYLTTAEKDASNKGAVMAAKIFSRGYHMAESEGIFFARVLNGMSGLPLISTEGEPRIVGVITASSFTARESWFAPLGFAGFLSAALPAAMEHDPHREGFLINDVFWQLNGGFVARYAEIQPLGFGFAESRPRDNTGNGLRGDNTSSPQTAFHLRTPPIFHTRTGPNVVIHGLHIWGSLARPEDFRMLPATLGGLKREVRTWQIDVSHSGRFLPPRYAHEQLVGDAREAVPITKHWNAKFGTANPTRVELQMDHIQPTSPLVDHGQAFATLELLKSERRLNIRVVLEFAGEVIDQSAAMSPLLSVQTSKGRQCVLETGGLIFENPDRMEQFDKDFKTAFLLVCGEDHYYFYLPKVKP